jgi:hypothetical protein
MRFVEYLLVEGNMSELKTIADDIMDQQAEEKSFNHDAALRVAKQRLKKMPEYKDPKKLAGALEVISKHFK